MARVTLDGQNMFTKPFLKRYVEHETSPQSTLWSTLCMVSLTIALFIRTHGCSPFSGQIGQLFIYMKVLKCTLSYSGN